MINYLCLQKQEVKVYVPSITKETTKQEDK